MIDAISPPFWVGLARASAGALLFSLPMMMTMEMWSLGPTSSPLSMAVLLLVTMPMLVGLATVSGFEEPDGWTGAVVDAFVAYAVGWATSFLILSVLAVMDVMVMSLGEIIGVISIQAVPASVGAMLAASQFVQGDDGDSDKIHDDEGARYPTTKTYFRELFIMAIGALFLALNVAPTEEMVLVAFKMTAVHACVLMLLSLAIMHGFVFVVKFRGQEAIPEEQSAWGVFFRFTIPGYAIALLISLFCLWAFDSTTHTGLDEIAIMTTVLGLPAAVGASAARLIL